MPKCELEPCPSQTTESGSFGFSREYARYSRGEKMVEKMRDPDLSVKPLKLITIHTTPEPLQIDLNRTALVIVDMQNAFLSKGGMLDVFGHDISGASKVIANAKKVMGATRKVGCRVIYFKMSFSLDYSDCGGPESPNWYKQEGLVMMRKNPQLWGKFVTQGSWDEEICDELKPQPTDIIIRKQRFSGFVGSNFDIVLKTLNIKYCVYIGVATNICIESTIRDGFFRDYWAILVSDACGHAGPAITQEATLWNVEHLFGWVTTTEDFVKAVHSD